MKLQAHVDRYVALKRHLGYKFVNNERILRSWAAWAMTRGDDLIVADTMLGWACDASSSAAAGKRLSVARRFAVWLQAEDPRHEVPPQHVLGPTTLRRPAPYLLTDAEIGTLMEAALSMFFRPEVGGGASAGDDFAVVDWQGCGLGPGLYDVAYFLGTNVLPGDRRRIEREALEEYHDIVCRLGARDFTFDDCWRSYRQNMLGVLVACILGCGGLDLGFQRLHDLVKSALERALAAIEDLDVAEFLPRGRLLSAGNAFSILSRGAYTAYRLSRRQQGTPND